MSIKRLKVLTKISTSRKVLTTPLKVARLLGTPTLYSRISLISVDPPLWVKYHRHHHKHSIPRTSTGSIHTWIKSKRSMEPHFFPQTININSSTLNCQLMPLLWHLSGVSHHVAGIIWAVRINKGTNTSRVPVLLLGPWAKICRLHQEARLQQFSLKHKNIPKNKNKRSSINCWVLRNPPEYLSRIQQVGSKR